MNQEQGTLTLQTLWLFRPPNGANFPQIQVWVKVRKSKMFSVSETLICSAIELLFSEESRMTTPGRATSYGSVQGR